MASAVALFEPLGKRDPDGLWRIDDNPRAVLRLEKNLGALLDSVVFGPQLANLSIGRLPNGDWTLTQPTFGTTNVAYELNRDARLWNNGQAMVPCRRTGDIASGAPSRWSLRLDRPDPVGLRDP